MPDPVVGRVTVAAATSPSSDVDVSARVPLSKRFRFGGVVEAAVIVGLAIVHDLYRNAVMGTRAEALARAKQYTRIERSLGLYHELDVQQFFLRWDFAIVAWNLYYNLAHFVVPAVVAIWLYRKFPTRYLRWRNVFFVMLFLTGPLGWYTFPVTPPKYMPASYGFVDTEVKYATLGTQPKLEYGKDGEPRPDLILALGNTYSGMPSHHVSWALWSLLAAWAVVRRRWVRGLLVANLVLVIGAITVTANHRWIDIGGSCIELAVAFGLVVAGERVMAAIRARRARARSHGPAELTPAVVHADQPNHPSSRDHS